MRTHCPKRVRVLIAGDDMAPSDNLKGLLPAEFEIVATRRDGKSQPLSRAAIELKPDVVLIDIAMAIQDRFKAVNEIIRHLPHARIVLYPNEEGPGFFAAEVASEEASEVAACGFASRHVTDRGLSRSVQAASTPNGHRTPFTRNASTPSISQKEVTDREHEVLALLAAGYPMKQIAYRLGITYRTVTFHKYRMMERLGITTNAGLMKYALQKSMEHKESVAA
jgi:DNA-binding NarL/FixJ family response regulator